MTLYRHWPYPHTPIDVNAFHKVEQRIAPFNQRLAVALTRRVSTMWCAYAFTVIAIIGLLGLLGWLNPFVFLLMTWLSQQFLQLVFLPVLSVGQGVLGRHQELQSSEAYNIALKNEHDITQIAEHLAVQDAELVEQTRILKEIKEK